MAHRAIKNNKRNISESLLSQYSSVSMKDRVVNSRTSAIAIGADQGFSVMTIHIFLARSQANLGRYSRILCGTMQFRWSEQID